jgi:3-deoxy-7-phosphoheptulonate synthase
MASPERIAPVSTAPVEWSPTSWQACPRTQQPSYPDADELNRALAQLRELPPLVTSWEILSL